VYIQGVLNAQVKQAWNILTEDRLQVEGRGSEGQQNLPDIPEILD